MNNFEMLDDTDYHKLIHIFYKNLATSESQYPVKEAYKGISLEQRVDLLEKSNKSYEFLLKKSELSGQEIRDQDATMISKRDLYTQCYCYEVMKYDLESLIKTCGVDLSYSGMTTQGEIHHHLTKVLDMVLEKECLRPEHRNLVIGFSTIYQFSYSYEDI
jgi:hypothetical protein